MLQVIWFKRDLRVFDHQPLVEASQRGPVLCIYVLEDEYWQLAETSNRQWLFIRESLQDLQQQLAALGGNLLIVRSSVCDMLHTLLKHIGPFTLYSHQETGNVWTYQRDIQVATWCKQHQIRWQEYAQHAVRRGLAKPALQKSSKSQSTEHSATGQPSPLPQSRKQYSVGKRISTDPEAWHQHWAHWSQQLVLPQPTLLHFADVTARCVTAFAGQLLTATALPWQVCDDEFTCPGRQLGGRQAALMVLDSFLTQRSQRYQASISSPLTAESGCSRLSAHLAYGTVSLREVLARLDLAVQQYPDRHWCRNLAAFRSRLVWHCYFMQKLENQPDAGMVNLNRKYDALVRPWDPDRFNAWRLGRTGWPLVDACMRYLIYHGWLNFRMRAMLVSVACYTLKLPWQPVSDYLATLFVDFEPGIHYPQIQMQSGTTGQQVLRIYNPVKQAQDLDPEGVFVRRWLPELTQVSNVWIFEPWRMPSQMRHRLGFADYPLPLVDFSLSHRDAKDEITLLRTGSSATKNTRPSSDTSQKRGRRQPRPTGNTAAQKKAQSSPQQSAVQFRLFADE
jgi:deoxyribodipyrimidine photo-lyase